MNWQVTTPSCLVKCHTTCDFSCGTCPTMVSLSLTWPDLSSHRGVIACSTQAIIPLHDLGTWDQVLPSLTWPDAGAVSLAPQTITFLQYLWSGNARLGVTFHETLTAYKSSRLSLSCLHWRIFPITGIYIALYMWWPQMMLVQQ